MTTIEPPPTYATCVDAKWRPAAGTELKVDTASVPAWPGVRPIFAPDGQAVLTYVSKMDGHVFFNAGYSAVKGSEATGVRKNAVDWRKDNGRTIDQVVEVVKGAVATQGRVAGSLLSSEGTLGASLMSPPGTVSSIVSSNETIRDSGLSSDWLIQTKQANIKKLPKNAFATHELTPALEMFRGTWMAFELAAPYLRYCFPALRAFWDQVMLKSHLGQMDFFPQLVRIADQGRGDGQRTQALHIDMDEADARDKFKPVGPPAKRARTMSAKQMDALERQINLEERGLVVLERKAEVSAKMAFPEKHLELLLEDKKLEVFREQEAEKRETARMVYEQSIGAQAALHRVDLSYYLVKQLNWERTERSKYGPCLYFSIVNNFILYGHTGISFDERYGGAKLDDIIVSGRMLILPMRDKEDGEAMEKAWSSIIRPLGIRRGLRERFVGEWEPFVAAVEKWNTDTSGRPELHIVMPQLQA